MKSFFKVIPSVLLLVIVIAFVQSAPADKDNLTENAADSISKLSNQAGEEHVTKSIPADTRTDAPSSAGTTVVAKPPATVTTFFDNIFNIPTSVLRAVNQFLNNNIKFGQGQSSKTAASGTATTPAPAAADVVTDSSVTGVTSSEVSGAQKNSTARESTFFDNIFNIPITAINSVNSLLTGRKVGENGEILPNKSNH